MDSIRLGGQYRALRLRKDKRQVDVAISARVSRPLISRIERGEIANVQVGDLERVAAALGATLDMRLRWHGEALDRLLDEDHARIVDLIVRILRGGGWDVVVEASFSIWGERGSIDVLGWHPASRSLLVVEVKSVVPDNQAMLMALDRKARLAPVLAADRGWQPTSVARLLVVGDSAVSRRRIARLASTYDSALPARGRDVRRWLRAPVGSLAGVLFLACAPTGSAIHGLAGRQRVRRCKGASRRCHRSPRGS
jgi:transcriptional regulator with XRE-family HTH domain